MTETGETEALEEVESLFAQGGQVAPHAGKSAGSFRGAEGAGDFLLQFDHAHVPFGQIVIEGHTQVGGKAQHFIAVLEQARHQ